MAPERSLPFLDLEQYAGVTLRDRVGWNDEGSAAAAVGARRQLVTSLRITNVGLVCASPAEVRTGLLGYVTCVVDDALMLDGITLRRTQAGRLTLSYPARRDRTGNQHHVVRPINDEARRDLEDQVFRALGIAQEVQP